MKHEARIMFLEPSSADPAELQEWRPGQRKTAKPPEPDESGQSFGCYHPAEDARGGSYAE